MKTEQLKLDPIFRVENTPTIVFGTQRFNTVAEAKKSALKLLLRDPVDAVLEAALENAEGIIRVLQWQPDGETPEKPAKAKTYSEAEWKAAQVASGYPMRILKSRVGLGWSLNKAATMPYTPRNGKPATQEVPAEPTKPAVVAGPVNRPF